VRVEDIMVDRPEATLWTVSEGGFEVELDVESELVVVSCGVPDSGGCVAAEPELPAVLTPDPDRDLEPELFKTFCIHKPGVFLFGFPPALSTLPAAFASLPLGLLLELLNPKMETFGLDPDVPTDPDVFDLPRTPRLSTKGSGELGCSEPEWALSSRLSRSSSCLEVLV
jgi:hypothetical protein